MKRFYFTVFLLGLIIPENFSQNTSDVQKILEQLSIKVKSAKGISASFVFTQYNKFNQVAGSSKGLVKIKNNKYYLKEDKIEIFNNGAQTWNFNGSDEVTVSKSDDSNEDDLAPQKILSGFNRNEFTYKLLSSAGANYEVLLLPVDKRKNFKQVILYVNKTTSLISKARITDKTDGITQISFSVVTLNAIIPDSQFNFDITKHPGVEVINQ